MKGVFCEAGNEGELFLEGTLRHFQDERIPFKIRKLELLKEVGLYTKEAHYFDRGNLAELRQELLDQYDDPKAVVDSSFVIRVASDPDRLSMPSFQVNSAEDVRTALDSLERLLLDEPSVRQIILRPFIPVEQRKDRIVGRLLLVGGGGTTEEILEIYKGAETTGIFDVVNPSHRSFRSFKKKAGEFMKPSSTPPAENNQETLFQEEELRVIYRQIENDRSKMEMARAVVASSRHRSPEDVSMSFEFSFLDGEFWYTDFD